jgi:hypothetical protein
MSDDKYKIRYHGIPCWISIEKNNITGRTWWANILIEIAIRIDNIVGYFYYKHTGKKRKLKITIEDV